MSHFVVRIIARLIAWAAGLLMAAWVVPHVSLSVSGFVVAVLVFSLVQAPVSWFILKLPHGYASMLLGTAGLTMTVVAMAVASALTGGLVIHGIAAWTASVAVVWLTVTIGAIILPDFYIGRRLFSA